MPPTLFLMTTSVGSLLLVSVQAMVEPGAVAAASRASVPVTVLATAVPPDPRPVHVAEAKP